MSLLSTDGIFLHSWGIKEFLELHLIAAVALLYFIFALLTAVVSRLLAASQFTEHFEKVLKRNTTVILQSCIMERYFFPNYEVALWVFVDGVVVLAFFSLRELPVKMCSRLSFNMINMINHMNGFVWTSFDLDPTATTATVCSPKIGLLRTGSCSIWVMKTSFFF